MTSDLMPGRSSAIHVSQHLASAVLALVILCASVALGTPAFAQDRHETSPADRDTVGDVTNPTPVMTAPSPTDAEKKVREMLKADGVHVVHFWAPWCSNAKNELDSGWGDLVRDNPDVDFVFISIWNDGESGSSVLESYDIPDRVTTLTLPDTGSSDNEDLRRRQFLGLPFTWSPSTWIFHQNGELAFAMNYGEMQMSTIQQLIDNTQADW